MKKTTIRDVANYAKVSISTVSRVINNVGNVDPKLAHKVNSAIQELNYIPNAVAQNLKSNSSHLIGYIISDIENSHFTILARNIENVLNSEGYNLAIFNTSRDPKREKQYLNFLISNNADGIIINTTGKNNDLIAKLSHQIPIIAISRRIDAPDYIGDFIDSDNYYGTYQLINYVLQMGHRDIAVINGNLSLSTGSERYSGFCRAYEEAGLTINHDYIFQGDFTKESAYSITANIFSSESIHPTVIIAMNNDMALGVMQYLIEHEISVPEQISLACYGNISGLNLMKIQPAFVSLDPALIGSRCGHLMLARQRAPLNAPSRHDVIIEPYLVKNSGIARL